MAVNLEAELEIYKRKLQIEKDNHTTTEMKLSRAIDAVHLLINAIPEGFQVPFLYSQMAAQAKKMIKE